ncbi:hypothetical protein F4778DRAFT_746012 [Xylariomycetidae sp. FL2044]|nr:hypothetical protein F4778DRAFT_746012 [Xylariomycetidae sp. FL2044]
MLLYTRLAPPKVPKRRSRAGCTFCKEKKKKCDEQRPRCGRCLERPGAECIYEVAKPRQRKKRDSHSGSTTHELSSLDASETLDYRRWDVSDDGCEDELISPVESRQDTASLINFPLSSDELLPSPTSPVTLESHDEINEDRPGDVIRGRSSFSLATPTQSRQPDLAMIAPYPARSPTLDFILPTFSEFSDRPNRRGLVDHFCNVLSHLIVFREESGNPFQQLVLPLSYQSLPVMNAIWALASAHLEYRGVENVEKSIHFHNQAIQGLARLIEMGGKVDKTEVLAAIMLLVYYEVLVQRGRTNIVDGHLKGALTIMCSSQMSSPAGLFLERAFRFYDVITALSLGTAPFSTAPAAGCLLPFPPMDASATSPLSNVDTLLGMSTTLWPIMHRLSNLLSLKCELEKATGAKQTSKVAVLRTEFESTSQVIESALAQWEPCLPPNVTSKDGVLHGAMGEAVVEKSRLQSILHNALAYRHSAFVYLYRTIYEHKPSHELVQKHAHLALFHCVETVAHRGPMGALLWPLFVSACEALSMEDRGLAEKAFVEIDMRQGMTNIEQAWRVVREVWKRLDMMRAACEEEKASDLWRKVSLEMGINVVFG